MVTYGIVGAAVGMGVSALMALGSRSKTEPAPAVRDVPQGSTAIRAP